MAKKTTLTERLGMSHEEWKKKYPTEANWPFRQPKPPKKFTATMKIGANLPASMKNYLQGATLDEGRKALRDFRKKGTVPRKRR
jgi:hypothetical protein